MAGAGSSWRIATFRPGGDPIGHLATALSDSQVLGANSDLGDTSRVVIEVTLRRSTLGLVEAVQQAGLSGDENVLLIVDQFEELFRFRESVQIANSRDEAIAFVKLLLEAVARPNPSIYVILTMRSDFIGDCMNFPGLPEAVNAGLYLVGRMSRERLRSAITSPVAVGGGAIAPRLVHRVLNDLGDDDDQLPLVQHTLSRTWTHWVDVRHAEGQIDVEDYEAVGTIRYALSKHADEAYDDATAHGLAATTERVFKALTDTFADVRGVRRPTSVSDLAAITEATQHDILRVVDIFRRDGRCFLMPPAPTPLTERSIVDLSHESLMRCWGRLITWAEQERAAAAFYARLSQAAAWFSEGTTGLWRNPELELAQRWRAETAPNAAWAARYDAHFDRTMAFLDRSLEERDRAAAALEFERRARLRRIEFVAGVLATLLIVAVALGLFAWRERRRAERNLDLAREAVDESLAAADRDPAQMGADLPQVQALRRDLLAKAEGFYREFMAQEPDSRKSRHDVATSHLRLGHIERMLDRPDEAERHYREAITRLSALVAADRSHQDDRQSLAAAYNWLGETLRRQVGRADEAGRAYDSALVLQRELADGTPQEAEYQLALARTLSNRGILRSSTGNDDAAAEQDFRDAIRRVEPLAGASALQELGRVANNLAALLDGQRRAEARTFYERAVGAHEALVQQYPTNTEYQVELATFTNNLAVFLHNAGATADALARSGRAMDLLTTLARPAPSLAIERADAHNLRGMILQAQSIERGLEAYAEALAHFRELGATAAVTRMPKFHMRFGDLLINLAGLASGPAASDRSRALLLRGLDQYIGVARHVAQAGSAAEIRAALDTVALVTRALGDRDARRLLEVDAELRRALDARGAPRAISRF
jgi:tetratricopeptide (TPR) repeat protein